METVGWAGAIVLALGGAVWILGYIFEQVPPLCEKAIEALKAMRAVRDEYERGAPGPGRPRWRGQRERRGESHSEDVTQGPHVHALMPPEAHGRTAGESPPS